MNFEDRVSSRKGRIGEQIVDEWLIAKGWVPYMPMGGVAHPFDRLVARKDKRKLCIVEVKTKPRRNAYRDTGINRRHYDDYNHITSTYRVPLFLSFVDEIEKLIYGNWWSELLKTREPDHVSWCRGCQSYPWEHKGQVYFLLVGMLPVAPLSDEQCAELKRLRTTHWVDNTEGVAVR